MYGGAGMDVGMTGMSGTTEAVPEGGSGAMPGGGMQMPGMGGGGGGGGGKGAPRDYEAKRHNTTDLDQSPARAGFARLSEIPERQRTYGTP